MPSFTIDRHNVTNRDYLRYLEERFKHVDVKRIYSGEGMGLIPATSRLTLP